MSSVAPPSGFFPRLQSMRGIAALIVMLGHIFISFPNGLMNHAGYELRPSNFPLSAGYVLFQANTAVIFFYVLSGFVLGGSFQRRGDAPLLIGWLSFAIKRAGRLLPVMWLSVLFAALVVSALSGMRFEGVTEWFNDPFKTAIRPGLLARNLVGNDTSINPLMWSVQVELVMVLLLPIMTLVIARTTLLMDAMIYAGLCVLSVTLWAKIPNAFIYSYCFYLGLMLPKILAVPAEARWLASGPAALLAIAAYVVTGLLTNNNLLWLPYKFLFDAAASVILLAYVLRRMDSPTLAFLDWPLLRTLGDISYSFYAYGLMIQLLVGAALLSLTAAPRVTNWHADFVVAILLLICIPVNFGLSILSYRYVELPMIGMSRDWARRFESRFARPARRAA